LLSTFFDSARRIQQLRNGPGGQLLEGFGRQLSQSSYAKITSRIHIRSAAHFLYWTDRNRIEIASLNEASVTDFLRHLKHCRCPRHGRTHRVTGARLLLRYLRKTGIVTTAASAPAGPTSALLAAFHQWMRQERGACDATIHNYSIYIRELLSFLGEDPTRYDAQSLRRCMLQIHQRNGRGVEAAKTSTLGVRMFLRFLIATAQCRVGLDRAIPTVAHWRLASLPRYLPAVAIERLIAACDTTTPIGRRDRAIVLLLARLALRADDIVQLRLEDIDWGGAWIHICGKGRLQTRLPLTQEVGEAIAAYLLDGRPVTESDRVFIRARAPFLPFSDSGAVSLLVAKVMHQAEITPSTRGAAHLLRHSAASSMLREGASLRDIALVLRHRSVETTQIYAKVDLSTLQPIAQPWPTVSPC
jgi:site-specific recombinase XerD